MTLPETFKHNEHSFEIRKIIESETVHVRVFMDDKPEHVSGINVKIETLIDGTMDGGMYNSDAILQEMIKFCRLDIEAKY